MADAGRAMMLYRGLYDNTHTYEKLDVVNYNGSLYISTTDGNLGTEPTEETKWKLFLQGGVADNIRATDTYGLVGKKGDSSFVQLLLDSLASRVQGVALNRQTLGYSKKNLLKNTATSTTNNGVTFTVNDDGSVTVNGTATAQARLLFKSDLVFDEDTILSIKGTTNGGVSGWYSGGNVFGSEKTVPAGTSYGGFFIFVNAGVTVNNVTVYPMIRSAEITDGTYEPYVDDVDTRLQKIDDSILNTLEEIDANTSGENIAGALAVKSLKSNLTNSIDTLNSKLAITNYSRGDMDAELNSIDLERGIYILLTYHGFALDYNGLFYVINTGYSEASKVVPIYQSGVLANMITLSVDYDNKKLIANRTPTSGAGSIKYNLYKFTNLHHFK